MASEVIRVTKKDLIELIKEKKDSDILGYLCGVQDGMEGDPHQVLLLFHPLTKIL